MKRSICIFAILLLPALCFGNKTADKLFAAGNSYYSNGLYKEALTTYQQVLNNGDQSAALYFNMGNASYKIDEIPLAIWYYEKAHKLEPADKDILFNIRFANLKTADKIDETPEFFMNRWWHSIILGYSITTLAISGIVLMLSASGLLIFYFFSRSVALKKVSFFSALILFVSCLLAIVMAVSQSDYFNDHKQAIIFSSNVVVKSAPAAKSASLFVIHEGTKINILENNHSWTKIKLANGNEGWISSADLREI